MVIATLLSACGGSAESEPPVVVAPPVVEPIPAVVTDPIRGASLFFNSPRVGQLICADCHSDNPAVNNFGNIWSGRNAASLIQRAVSSNTGGMGVFANLYSEADLADIAAFLGNSPASLIFPPTGVGQLSTPLRVTVSSSTKVGIANFSVRRVGDFQIAATNCGTAVERFSSCTVDMTFAPTMSGPRSGALLLSYDGIAAPISIVLNGDGT